MTIIIIDLCFYERALRKFMASRFFQILIKFILYPSYDDFDINQMSVCTVCLPTIKNHIQNVIPFNPFNGVLSLQFNSLIHSIGYYQYVIIWLKMIAMVDFSLDMEASVKTLDVKWNYGKIIPSWGHEWVLFHFSPTKKNFPTKKEFPHQPFPPFPTTICIPKDIFGFPYKDPFCQYFLYVHNFQSSLTVDVESVLLTAPPPQRFAIFQ